MTCKDCLHYEVCYTWARQNLPMFLMKPCDHFKDRSKWVEQKHGRCKWCDGEYHTKIMASAIRYHSNGNMDGYELPVKFCPNCGADMREGSVGE